MKPTQTLHEDGQSLWLDNITRGLLDSGTLHAYIEQYSITGSSPTRRSSTRPSKVVRTTTPRTTLDATGASDEEVFFELALSNLRRAADVLDTVHEHSEVVDGWVSLEVSPLLAHDAADTIAQATSLHAKAERPNVFIKIPGTPEGLRAIEECTFAGIAINVTLLFSRSTSHRPRRTCATSSQDLAEQLRRDGAESFDKSWHSLLGSITSKHEELSMNG